MWASWMTRWDELVAQIEAEKESVNEEN